MKKLKIYLDTSVISHLKQDDTPEKVADTLRLWEDIKANKYDVYTSEITIEELVECPEPKKSYLLEKLNEIEYKFVPINNELTKLAEQIINLGILKKKSFDDCQHIAAAIVYDCDIIVSWNFKHIVNPKTVKGVRAITTLDGHKDIFICSPPMLNEMEE